MPIPCNRLVTGPAAQAADDAYQAAIIAAGFKSRWALPRFSDMPKAVQEARDAKLAADEADHAKWVEWLDAAAAERAGFLITGDGMCIDLKNDLHNNPRDALSANGIRRA